MIGAEPIALDLLFWRMLRADLLELQRRHALLAAQTRELLEESHRLMAETEALLNVPDGPLPTGEQQQAAKPARQL